MADSEFVVELKKRMADRAYTQADLAYAMRYTSGRIGQILRGEKPSLPFAIRAAETFGESKEKWMELAGFKDVIQDRNGIVQDMARLLHQALKQMDPSELTDSQQVIRVALLQSFGNSTH